MIWISETPTLISEPCYRMNKNDDVSCVKWNPLDGHTLLTGSTKGILKMYNIQTWKDIFSEENFNWEITQISFDPFNQQIFGVCNSNSVQIFDLRNYKSLVEFGENIKEFHWSAYTWGVIMSLSQK